MKQIVHAAEATRQYPRYRIPAWIEIDGKRYKLQDWSLGGCAIEDPSEELLSRTYARGNFICPFEEFEVVIKDLNLQFLEKRQGNILAARFENLTPEQIALFKEIINAYLEGAIEVLPEQFINAIRREDLRAAVEARRPSPPPETKLKILKQVFIFLLLLATFSVLVSFLALALKERVFTVHANSAYIAAELDGLRAPITGVFEPAFPLEPGVEIKKGAVVGYMRSPVFGSIVITSPVEGRLVRLSSSLPVVKEGEPILFVLPPGGRIFVRAFVAHKEVKNLKVGEKALVSDSYGRQFYGTIKRILVGTGKELPETESSYTLPARSLDYDTLVIEPERSIDASRIGEAVHVKITVYPGFLRKFLGKDGS